MNFTYASITQNLQMNKLELEEINKLSEFMQWLSDGTKT